MSKNKRRDPQPSDGRYIDPRLGSLSGEAALQETRRRADEVARSLAVVKDSDVPQPAPDRSVGYYDLPLLKQPVWIWTIPAYFYLGGVAGAASVLAASGQLLAPKQLVGLVLRCRRLALGSIILGTVCLIADLGRPGRFLNMLRVFRPTSAMSVGSWILTLAATCMATGVLLADRKGAAGRAGKAATLAAGLLGMPLAGYTGILLADTSVPLWRAGRRELPALFVASAMAGASSLLELTPFDGNEALVVHRFGLVGKAAELAAMRVFQRAALKSPEVGRPLRNGVSGSLWKTAGVLAAAGFVLSLSPTRGGKKRTAAAVLGTLGALALRFAVFYAGKRSAIDPVAVMEQQRPNRGNDSVSASLVSG